MPAFLIVTFERRRCHCRWSRAVDRLASHGDIIGFEEIDADAEKLSGMLVRLDRRQYGNAGRAHSRNVRGDDEFRFE